MKTHDPTRPRHGAGYPQSPTVLVHGSPKVAPLATDLHEHLVQVPLFAQPPLSTFELSCVLGPELPAPMPDGLVGNNNPSLRQLSITHKSSPF